ncbi:hypothetical protein V6N13_138351 [Hibiscus sabdariffa]|uniref:Uncharacterized protein n=1 Tax=Hibiscus sabdariffa TaxID=183260 RepID=A0ABR2QD40_9ROSI
MHKCCCLTYAMRFGQQGCRVKAFGVIRIRIKDRRFDLCSNLDFRVQVNLTMDGRVSLAGKSSCLLAELAADGIFHGGTPARDIPSLSYTSACNLQEQR